MKRDASPGPDGLNVAFYRAAWPWIADDITTLVQEFFNSGTLPEHTNKTYIVLIPKKTTCLSPQDFRPISLCNVFYKIIAKSLAERCKNHLPHLIHHSQHAFIKGRNITTNIILAQEIAHSFQLRSWNFPGFMLKLDLAKAFDRIEWPFIAQALRRQGFHDHFVDLVINCMNSASFSVLVNGQPFGTFSAQRGIRQGCPLSPYLFVIAINELSICLQEALDNESLSGICLGPNCPPIHSLMFADDLIICGKADYTEASAIKQILENFCKLSGQTPNWSKSSILFSKKVSEPIKLQLKNLFPVPDLEPNTIHLGHPLIINQNDRIKAYDFIHQKFKIKLTTIKANKLNHAGRLAYIQSVFASIPIYYMAHVLLKKKLLAKITTIVRKFWWAGVQDEDASQPLHFRAWEDICRDKAQGGLGIKRIDLVNKSLLLKMAWSIVSQQDPLLSAILKAKYYPNNSFWTAPMHTPRSLFWASILKIKNDLHEHSFYQIANGNTNIWSHPWTTTWEDMHDRFQLSAPRNLIPNIVSDLWIPHTKQWDTQKIELFFGAESVHEFKNIQILNYQHEDYLCWDTSTSGCCTAKEAYLMLAKQNQTPTPTHGSRALPQSIIHILNIIWKHNLLQPRFKTFAWRLLRQALATGQRAGRFSQHIDEKCIRCGNIESDSHLFFSCDFARAVWFAGMPSIRTDQLPLGQHGVQQEVSSLITPSTSLQEIQRIITTMWFLWKARNDLRFNNKEWKVSQVLHAVKADMHITHISSQELLTQQPAPILPQNTTSPHGSTHAFFVGARCFVDASITPDVQRYNPRQAGLGIFIEAPQQSTLNKILIQATIETALDPLQAEAHALTLASAIIKTLQLPSVQYMTDSKLLATNLQREDPVTQAADWRIRHLLADFLYNSEMAVFSVIKIPRQGNPMAHSLAAQARTQAGFSACLYVCNNPTHSETCTVKSALQNIDWGGYCLNSVSCL
ncbi:unnamed protein product [Urochloa humidicola]